MKINMDVQADYFVKELGKKGNSLQLTAQDTLNESAEKIKENYNMLLKSKAIVRTKFTTNATRVFKANGVRKNNTPRPLSGINSKVVVRKMKGGKEHYLAKLETGTTQRGNPLTKGKVPVPLNTARTGKNYNKSIARTNRLDDAPPQTLKIRGKSFGVPGDKHVVTRQSYKKGQRFAILSQYSKEQGNLQGDPKRPFFFIDNSNNLGIFKMIGRKFRKIRKLEKSSVKRKANPIFQTAVKTMPAKKIKETFVNKAKRLLQ